MIATLLLSLLAFADSCDRYAVAPGTPGTAPKKTAQDGYRYVQDCDRGQNWARVENSREIQNLIHGFAGTVGQNLPVYSCYRSQQSQNEILCRNHCGPNFGTRVCEGRVAANLSEHTVGIAADIIVQTSSAGGSNAQLRNEAFHMCSLLDQNRKQNNGGWGGITVYGVDAKTGRAYLHMDVKKDWCNWGACQDMPELGEGNCKRTKYRATEQKLMQERADAQTAQDEAAVQHLGQLLKQLQASCQPGDTSCRDLYKTL